MSEFKKELEHLINRHSKENDSDTPDFILAQYLYDCLASYDKAVKRRDEWYNFKPWPEGAGTGAPIEPAQ